MSNMPDAISILNIPLLARNVAALRRPRIFPDAQDHYGDWVSRDVSSGNWNIDPTNGQPLHSSGRDIDADLEHYLSSRPHAIMPLPPLADPADDLWIGPANITKRGARYKELLAFAGSAAAALVLLKEEAAAYGVTDPFSTQAGEKIDPKAKAHKPKVAGRNNPWSSEFVGDAESEKARLIRTLGTRGASGIAAGAGVSVFGAPIRK
jgi:hypothetical protein